MARYYSAIIVSVDGCRLPAEMMETDQSKRTNLVDRSCSSAALADVLVGPPGSSVQLRLVHGPPAVAGTQP
jgi:hypothetical protein